MGDELNWAQQRVARRRLATFHHHRKEGYYKSDRGRGGECTHTNKQQTRTD